MFANAKAFSVRVLLIAGLIAVTSSSFVSFRAAAQPSPPSRPILFVHGWCGSAYDWAPLYGPIFGLFPSAMYPDPDVYLVEYNSGTDSVAFWKQGNPSGGDDSTANALTPVSQDMIPPAARFFVIAFVDPVANSTANTNVAKISVLNKADEIAQVIKRITAITGVPQVNILAHSMGGLDARAYVENMAATNACYDYTNNVPSYSGTCNPGAEPYAGDVANIITLKRERL